jgi:hypothetical protein
MDMRKGLENLAEALRDCGYREAAKLLDLAAYSVGKRNERILRALQSADEKVVPFPLAATRPS